MILAAFNFRVKHRAGRSHGNADGLSRARQPVDDDTPFHLDVMEDLLDGTDLLDPEYLLTSIAPTTDEEPEAIMGNIGPQQALLEAAPCKKCKQQIKQES